jgi:exopolysaccharide production protein ExoY
MTDVTRALSRDEFRPSAPDVPLGGVAKRCLDVVAALAGLILLSPLLIACAVAVRLASPGPIFFSQRRIGFGGRRFNCLKFRTMVVDAETRLREYLESDPLARREWETIHKLRNDPRTTSIGALLRGTSLDELPQLINVLRGDMSMVGPRPIVDGEIVKYNEKFPIYISGRPGLTGLWQISGRSQTTYAERVAYDVAYVQNWSLVTDVKLMLLTVPHLLGSDDAC